jgi:hypothetical protein
MAENYDVIVIGTGSAANPLVEVCYCFGYTLSRLQLATTPAQKEIILADIREGIAKGQCGCDLRNPRECVV